MKHVPVTLCPVKLAFLEKIVYTFFTNIFPLIFKQLKKEEEE